MKRFILTTIIIFISGVLYAAPERKISWEPVGGAWGYFIEIRNSSGTVIVSSEIRDSSYPVTSFEPGEYSFRIATINILRQKGESTDWIKFTVEKLYIPKLKSLSKNRIVSSYSNSIVVSGSGFRPETKFLLRGNGTEIELPGADTLTSDKAVIDFEPSSSSKGIYDFVVVNRGGVEDVLKGAIEIVEPAEAERYFFLSAGYNAAIPFGKWAEYFSPSLTGGRAQFQFSFKTPALENILIGFGVDVLMFNSKEGVLKSSLLQCTYGVSAGYYFPFRSIGMEIFLRGGGGQSYSVLTLDESIINKKTKTFDWYAAGETGLRFYIGERFFIEPAAIWKTVFYQKEFFNEAAGSLSVGVKI